MSKVFFILIQFILNVKTHVNEADPVVIFKHIVFGAG